MRLDLGQRYGNADHPGIHEQKQDSLSDATVAGLQQDAHRQDECENYHDGESRQETIGHLSFPEPERRRNHPKKEGGAR